MAKIGGYGRNDDFSIYFFPQAGAFYGDFEYRDCRRPVCHNLLLFQPIVGRSGISSGGDIFPLLARRLLQSTVSSVISAADGMNI